LRPARGGLTLAAAAAMLAGGVAFGAGAASRHAPRVDRVQCVSSCAGAKRVAAGSVVRWSGRHLAKVKVVRFPAAGGGRVHVKPLSRAGGVVTARVPADAASGRPSLIPANGGRVFAKAPLAVVPKGQVLGPDAFKLLHSRARPKVAFFAGRRVHLSYRFRARGPRNVKLNLVRVATGTVVDRITRRQVNPFAKHHAIWNGAKHNGKPAPAGSYELRVARVGEHGEGGSRFRVYPFDFPVRGSHSYGGAEQRFGAPRSGGRIHQGQDVFSPCGTREVAARGGRVQAEGYDPVLYGYWLVIDGRGTGTDYRYAHLEAPTPLRQGQRVRTAQTVGHVGRTGNARTVGCMLHFEEWPQGWESGSPVDPLPDLQRWDSWN
jgi:murein DD-endopeptidase MepM/ murein hydrolase activator NlpD